VSFTNGFILTNPTVSEIELRIGGFARWSSCDWPGKLAATVFLQGCPWRCPYCHNPHLLEAVTPTVLSWPEIEVFLKRRRGLLDAVVFSGGEPTLQRDLPAAMKVVRDLGFSVGLHTAGPYPDTLKRVLPLVDWVGFDVKAPFGGYDELTKTPGSERKARKSLLMLLEAGVSYEIRTTVHPALLTEAALQTLKEEMAALGVQRHKIQNFRAQGCETPELLTA